MTLDVKNNDVAKDDRKAVNLVHEDDGDAEDVGDSDDSNSENRECFNVFNDNVLNDDNNDEKCCACNLCYYTCRKRKAKQDQFNKCFKYNDICHVLCSRLISHNNKLYAKSEVQHNSRV